MSRLLVLVLLGQTLGACADARWSDVGAGPKITEERWYANGLVATLGPRALARYAEHGPELLSLALPSGVVIPTKTRQALIGPASVAVGEALPAPRAMPVALAAALEETQQAIRLDVTFTTLTYRRPMTGIGAACAAAVTLPSPQLRLALVGRRDVAGHVFFEPTVDGAIVSAGTPTITLDAGCTLGDGAALSTQLGEWALDDVRAALTATSSDAGTSPVSRLALLGARLFGAALPGRLELAVPDAGGFDGRMTVELSPATVDGTSQVVHVGTTGAVLALHVPPGGGGGGGGGPARTGPRFRFDLEPGSGFGRGLRPLAAGRGGAGFGGWVDPVRSLLGQGASRRAGRGEEKGQKQHGAHDGTDRASRPEDASRKAGSPSALTSDG